MSKLNILFTTPWYPSRSHPVQGTFVEEHAKAARLFHEVVVMHHASVRARRMERRNNREPSGEHGISVYRFRYRGGLNVLSFADYLASGMRCYQHILRGGFVPQVIHAHTFWSGLLALTIGKARGIPVVISEHYSGFRDKKLSLPERWAAGYAFNRARLILPVSQSLQKDIEGYGIKASFQVMPNAVDPAIFSPKSPPRDRAGNDCRLLYVGTLRAEKGVRILLAALGNLSEVREDWRMDIVGDGPEWKACERDASRYGIRSRVAFHGARSKAEVAGFMRLADGFVLPSQSETFSVVVAESLVVGTPVLATRCGGPEEYLCEACGVVVPAGDSGALFQGLVRFLETLDRYSPAEISRYGQGRFSTPVIGERLDEVYRELARNGSGGGCTRDRKSRRCPP